MIIKRRYEYFYRLIERDPKAKLLYEKACDYPDKEFSRRVYEFNLYSRACELDMGSGMNSGVLIWDGFDKLDKEEPYDNGFTLDDVNCVEIYERSSKYDNKPWIDIVYIKKTDDLNHIVMYEHKEED